MRDQVQKLTKEISELKDCLQEKEKAEKDLNKTIVSKRIAKCEKKSIKKLTIRQAVGFKYRHPYDLPLVNIYKVNITSQCYCVKYYMYSCSKPLSV